MAATTVPLAHSLNPGADLWVTADLSESKNTQRLDWHLNFQISRSKLHSSCKPSVELSQIIQDSMLETFSIPESSGMMISSSHLVPARWVIVQPGSDSFSTWIKGIHKTWQNLSKPTLRVFLPQSRSAVDFQTTWSKLSDFDDYSVVLDT